MAVRERVTTLTCPICGSETIGLIKDSRPAEIDGQKIMRRRRHCDACGNRWVTYEIPANDYDHTLLRAQAFSGIVSETPDLIPTLIRLAEELGRFETAARQRRRPEA